VLQDCAVVSTPHIPQKDQIVIGHCFGGLCALDLARASPPGLKAAVSFHGPLTPPNIAEQLSIKANILILHGCEDPFAPSSDVFAIAKELTARVQIGNCTHMDERSTALRSKMQICHGAASSTMRQPIGGLGLR
jgi:dienelactone hydrolase